jgi:hypothetical protein
MLGLSLPAPSEAELLAQAARMALPAAAKARLHDVAQQIDVLNQRRTELAALEKVDADRKKAIATLKAELDARAQDLDARDAALAARAAAFAKVVAAFDQNLAAHAASLEQTT